MWHIHATHRCAGSTRTGAECLLAILLIVWLVCVCACAPKLGPEQNSRSVAGACGYAEAQAETWSRACCAGWDRTSPIAWCGVDFMWLGAKLITDIGCGMAVTRSLNDSWCDTILNYMSCVLVMIHSSVHQLSSNTTTLCWQLVITCKPIWCDYWSCVWSFPTLQNWIHWILVSSMLSGLSIMAVHPFLFPPSIYSISSQSFLYLIHHLCSTFSTTTANSLSFAAYIVRVTSQPVPLCFTSILCATLCHES